MNILELTISATEGQGRSTLILLLTHFLESKGFKTVPTKEPLGTRCGHTTLAFEDLTPEEQAANLSAALAGEFRDYFANTLIIMREESLEDKPQIPPDPQATNQI